MVEKCIYVYKLSFLSTLVIVLFHMYLSKCKLMVVFQTLFTFIDYNKCTISRMTFLNFQTGVFHSRLILWSWQHSKYQQVQYLREKFF